MPQNCKLVKVLGLDFSHKIRSDFTIKMTESVNFSVCFYLCFFNVRFTESGGYA